MDPNDWTLTGNAGTNPATNFLGTTDNEPLVINPVGNVNIGTFDSAIPYPKLTVTGPVATVNVETTEILRVMRHGDPGVKNQNSAGFFVGAFESGFNGRSQLDIKVAGTPGPSNTFGSVPDVTVMSLHGDGNVSIGTTNLGARLEIRGGTYGITSRGTDVGIYTQNITTPGSKVFLATTEVAGDFYGDVILRSNVGIGTNQLDAQLTVAGDVTITGHIKNGGSDLTNQVAALLQQVGILSGQVASLQVEVQILQAEVASLQR